MGKAVLDALPDLLLAFRGPLRVELKPPMGKAAHRDNSVPGKKHASGKTPFWHRENSGGWKI
jgi:hypothetical protein